MGATLELRGVTAEVFRQRLRLTVDSWGSVRPAAEPLMDKVYEVNNLSETVYELTRTFGDDAAPAAPAN